MSYCIVLLTVLYKYVYFVYGHHEMCATNIANQLHAVHQMDSGYSRIKSGQSWVQVGLFCSSSHVASQFFLNFKLSDKSIEQQKASDQVKNLFYGSPVTRTCFLSQLSSSLQDLLGLPMSGNRLDLHPFAFDWHTCIFTVGGASQKRCGLTDCQQRLGDW